MSQPSAPGHAITIQAFEDAIRQRDARLLQLDDDVMKLTEMVHSLGTLVSSLLRQRRHDEGMVANIAKDVVSMKAAIADQNPEHYAAETHDAMYQLAEISAQDPMRLDADVAKAYSSAGAIFPSS